MFILSWFIYIMFAYGVHNSDYYKSFATMTVTFSSLKIYLSLILIAGTTFIFDLFIYSAKRIFFPSTLDILERERKIKGNLNNIDEIPEKLSHYVEEIKNFEKM